MDYHGLLNSFDRGLFSPVYLLFGEEVFLRDEILHLFKNKLIPAEVADFNLDIVDGQVVSAEEVVQMANTLPFMSEKRLVIVNDARWFESKKKNTPEPSENEQAANQEAPLLNYLAEPLDSTCLVFAAKTVDKRKKIYKAIEKVGQIAEFTPLKGRELNAWIEKKAHSLGKKITPEAMAKMVTSVGSNLNLLDNELQKLALYSENRPQIDKGDVELLVSRTVENSIFDLVDAVGERKYNKALLLIRDMLFCGEAPIKILFMIIRQFRLILAAKIMSVQGYSEKQIAGKLQTHPFVTQKCLRQGKNFSQKELELALAKLLDADEAMKTGKQEPLLALERLVLELGS